MISAEKLAEWKALAEAAPPVRQGEQPIYLEVAMKIAEETVNAWRSAQEGGSDV